MPKVHQQKANKDYPDKGIKKGEVYYSWTFRRGGKRVSKTYPKASQLTQSEFWQAVYRLQEDYDKQPADLDGIKNAIDDIKERLEETRDEQEEKRQNMEEKFPNGCPVMETLQERYDALDEAINTLEDLDTDSEPDMDAEATDETKAQRLEDLWRDATDALHNISCS